MSERRQRGLLARARERYELGGLPALSGTLVQRLGFRHLVIFERSLRPAGTGASPAIEGSAVEGLRVAPLGTEHAEQYAALRPFDGARQLRERLAAGSLAIGAWLGADLVSVAWWHPGEAWIPEIGLHIVLPSHFIYAYDSYTRRDLRGRGITPARALRTFAMLADLGFTRGLCYVLAHNRPSMRAVRKIGWQPTAEIRALALPHTVLMSYSRAGRAPRLCVRRRDSGPWPGPPPVRPPGASSEAWSGPPGSEACQLRLRAHPFASPPPVGPDRSAPSP